MNLASFYLCLFMNINTSAIEAALKSYIVRKEGNYMYKYLVASYTHHFRNDLLSLFFFFLQVCFWAIYDMKLKFSFILGYLV